MNRIYVDSSVWISRYEGLPSYRNVINQYWMKLMNNQNEICISGFVQLEVLCKPIRARSLKQQRFYETILSRATILDNYETLLSDAMTVMYEEKLNAMDCIHIAMARHYPCRYFFTTDKHFKRVATVPVTWIQLSD